MTRRALAACVVVSWLSGATVRAQTTSERPLSEALRVEPGDAPCLTPASLVDRVGRWLGTTNVDVAIGVDVAVAGDGVSFVMSRDGETSAERRFDVLPRACPARLAAVSLAIALAIDHTVLERVSAQELHELSGGSGGTGGGVADDVARTSEQVRADEQGETSLEALGPVEAPSSGRRTYGPGAGPDLSLAVGGFVSAGVVPDLAPGARVEVGLGFGPTWSLRFAGLFVGEVDGRLGDGSVAASLLAGEIQACAGVPLGRLRLGGCAGPAAGALSAHGVDFQVRAATTREWLAGTAAVELALPVVWRVALRSRVELLVPLLRPSLKVVDGTGNVLAEETALPIGGLLALEMLYPMP